MRLKDNTPILRDELVRKYPNEKIDFGELKDISNITIRGIQQNKYPNIFVFPQKANTYKDDILSSKIFLLSENELKTGNIMGFIGLNNTDITISSRFIENEKEDYFLYYMLQKVLSINVSSLKHSGGNDDIWELLIFLFPLYLNNALGQGLYKEYKYNEYNDANVRGIIDVKRHIQKNIPFTGKVAYSTREYSYNNPITQIIRHTIEFIKAHEWGGNILTGDTVTTMNVNKIILATSTYNRNSRQKTININRKKPVVHPYFTEYKTLQRLCLRILCNEKVAYNSENEKIHGILFDGAWLWEEYLNTILSKKSFIHPKNKTGEGKRFLFWDEDKMTNEIYPDFYKEPPYPIIADAKYKHLDEKTDNSDFYQMISYMHRFETKKGYLLFPYPGKYPPKTKNLLKGFDDQIGDDKVTLYGVQIPQNCSEDSDFQSGYSKFRIKMKDTEDNLIKDII